MRWTASPHTVIPCVTEPVVYCDTGGGCDETESAGSDGQGCGGLPSHQAHRLGAAVARPDCAGRQSDPLDCRSHSGKSCAGDGGGTVLGQRGM